VAPATAPKRIAGALFYHDEMLNENSRKALVGRRVANLLEANMEVPDE